MFAIQRDILKDLEIPVIKTMTFPLRTARKDLRQTLFCAEVMRKHLSIRAVQDGRHNIVFRGEGSECSRGSRLILKGHRRSAVVSNDFRLRGQVLGEQMTKRDEVVDQEAGR